MTKQTVLNSFSQHKCVLKKNLVLVAKGICNTLQHLYAEDNQDETKGKLLSQQRSHDFLTHVGTM
jgi:hypothetical protein